MSFDANDPPIRAVVQLVLGGHLTEAGLEAQLSAIAHRLEGGGRSACW